MRLPLAACLLTAALVAETSASKPAAPKPAAPAATPAAAPAGDSRQAVYEREIKPLMERSCNGCHSAAAKKRRGGFLADSIANLERGGKENGPGITWGKPMESSVYLLSKANRGDDLAMPPRKSKAQPLTPAELEILRKWIETSR